MHRKRPVITLLRSVKNLLLLPLFLMSFRAHERWKFKLKLMLYLISDVQTERLEWRNERADGTFETGKEEFGRLGYSQYLARKICLCKCLTNFASKSQQLNNILLECHLNCYMKFCTDIHLTCLLSWGCWSGGSAWRRRQVCCGNWESKEETRVRERWIAERLRGMQSTIRCSESIVRLGNFVLSEQNLCF